MTTANARTPLLGRPDHYDNDQCSDSKVSLGSVDTRAELITLLRSSFPLILTSLLQFFQIGIALMFVGRIGKDELAAVSLGCLTANVTGWSVFMGLASALDTLCPQAYGAGLHKMVGLHTQRMTMLLLCFSVPISLFWYNSYSFIRLLIHDDNICKMAQSFMRILIFGCPGFACFECGKRFLQAQGHFAGGLYTFLVCIPLQVLSTWMLVKRLEFGIEGIAISLSITRSLLPFGLLIYSWVYSLGDCWRPLDTHVFQNWLIMVKLALPSVVMYEADTIAFEVLTIMAGKFGTAELGAQTLLVTLCSFIYRTPIALGIAVGTEVATRLGEGSLGKARRAASTSLWLAAIFSVVAFVVMLSARKSIPWILTNDETIVKLMQAVLPLTAILTVADAFTGVLNGIMRGIGKQSFGAWAQTIACYVVGLPVCVYTAFGLDWQLKGLWTGIALAMAAAAVLEGVYLWALDWDRLLDDARRRNAIEADD